LASAVQVAAFSQAACATFEYAPTIVCFGVAYALLGVGLRDNLQRL
jgi:hypothetical protein